MNQLKFDENGAFIPQRVNYNIKHEEEIEEMLENYLNNECNFQIKYDNKSNPIFIKKEKGGK